jgi:gas vesicle protein
LKERNMRRKAHRNYGKSNAGKVITGLLVGGVVGATVGWLTAPASGEEIRRRLKDDLVGAREKARSAMENVESKARELAAEVRQPEQLP